MANTRPSADERSSVAVLWLTIVAAPGALGVETAMRLLLFPDEFERVRELLRPFLTPVAWLCALIAGAGGVLGVVLQRRLVAQRVAKLEEPYDTRERRRQIAFGVFLLTTATPQIPSIFATFCFMFGSSLVPVVVAIALATVGVVVQAQRVARLIA